MKKKIGEILRSRQVMFRFAVLLALVLTAVSVAACVAFDCSPLPLAAGALLLYAGVMLLYWLCRMLAGGGAQHSEKKVLSAQEFELLNGLRTPALLCGDDGQIQWCNRELLRLDGKRDLRGMMLEELLEVSLNDIMAVDELDVNVFGTVYGLRGYRLHGQNRCLLLWSSKQAQEELRIRFEEESMVIAYIMVDNLEEMMQVVQEKYRAISGEVEGVLRAWAEGAQGFLKEYERDRYLFIFDARHLRQFFDQKFDVLDRIRDIRVGEGSLPVTISIGVSGSEGSFADKDRDARSALDMALQRGGDQVVVKTGAGLDFFGGRSKGVQKLTKVRSRVMANELVMQLSKSSNVLIMGHRNMDFDALGSCAGVARLADFCGVRSNVIINESDPNMQRAYALLRRLPEYANRFIGGSDALELVNSDTLLVICDVNNPKQFECADLAASAFRTVIIDHHRKAAEFAQQPVLSYIEPAASSACELVAEILEQAIQGSGQLSKEEADLMFAGILLDTKHFTHNTGARTFSAAMYLRGEGANPVDAEALFQVDLESFCREARMQSHIITYHTHIGIALSESADNSAQDYVAAAKAADNLLRVDGIYASFAIVKIGDVVQISARSSGSVNVQLIVERLGGGGHFDAAATQLRGVSATEALEMLKEAIDDYLTSRSEQSGQGS